jgi:2-hydroxycyclohexanecarboxyl-CoA dehydrogenase
MDTGLKNRAVIVTGATANIGRAIALSFAGEGAKVAVVGRDEAQGARVVEAVKAAGAADALWIKADLLQDEDAAAMRDKTLARFGAIDVLINNVGGNVDVGAFVSTTPKEWRGDIELTLMTTLRCTHAVLPHMIERGHGRIVNIGSMSGIIGDANLAVYSAAKGAVHAFTKVLAKEVGMSNITVNAIAPYVTLPESPDDTSSGSRFHPTSGLFSNLPEQKAQALMSIHKKGVLPRTAAKPSEIGAAAVYLASDHAAYITGEVLCVDGGVRLS